MCLFRRSGDSADVGHRPSLVAVTCARTSPGHPRAAWVGRASRLSLAPPSRSHAGIPDLLTVRCSVSLTTLSRFRFYVRRYVTVSSVFAQQCHVMEEGSKAPSRKRKEIKYRRAY